MLLIPEIETVVILIPRTGSGSLRRALGARYPQSMLIYRHMEADGVPHGYDRWNKVCVVRDPVERMWSLYKFLRDFDRRTGHDPAYVSAMCAQAERPFCEWLVSNEVTFTSPYDSAGLGRFWPQYACRYPMPENRKSQFMYARPDLGTTIFQFSALDEVEERFDATLPRFNATAQEEMPPLTAEARQHFQTWFKWDLKYAEPSAKAVAA